MTDLPVRIYQHDDGSRHPYTIVVGQEWPWGAVVATARTLKRARALAAKIKATHAPNDPVQVEAT